MVINREITCRFASAKSECLLHLGKPKLRGIVRAPVEPVAKVRPSARFLHSPSIRVCDLV